MDYNDLTIIPNVNRRAVCARHFPSRPRGTTHTAAGVVREALVSLW
jgi:hypothetical protein